MFTIILACVVFIVTSLAIRRRKVVWQDLLSQFEGPPHYPIVGHCIPSRWSVKKAFNEMIHDWFPMYKSPFTLFLVFRTPVVIIYDPENFQIVANKTLEKATDYKYIRRFYGNGIATINDIETWKKRRRLLLPSISLKMMGSYYLDAYNKLNHELVEEFEIHAEKGDEIDLWPYVHHNICCIYFESFIKFDKKDRTDIELSKLAHAVPNGLKYVMNRIFFPWIYHDTTSNVGEWLSGTKRYFQNFDNSRKKIFEKLQARKSKLNTEKSQENGEQNSRKSFIETLSSKEGSELYSSEELMEEIMTFFIAATETTAVNISFTMLMLAMHPESQEKVFQEIQRVLGAGNKTATMDDLNQLVYLDQCVNETFRLFPSIPWIARQVTKTVTLKDGRILPPGCDVLLAIIGIHRREDIYEDPLLWKPDRFLPDQVSKRHPCSFVPFSVGARNCLAWKIGVLSIKSQIVSLIQKYKFTTRMKLSDVESNLNFDVDLRNQAGFHVRLQKREL